MARGGHVAALSLPPRLAATTTPYCGRPVRASCARPVPGGARRRGRGRLMVVRAGGPPSTNQLILAFVLPLSLFVGTLVTAARVADDLDDRFLREVPYDSSTTLPRASVTASSYCVLTNQLFSFLVSNRDCIAHRKRDSSEFCRYSYISTSEIVVVICE